MANNSNQGFEHRFAFNSNGGSFSAGGGTRFEVVGSTIGKQGEILDAQGVLGSRHYREDRSRAGIYRVSGDLELEPSPKMLDFFKPYILGASESTDDYSVADVLSGFDMQHDFFASGGTAAFLYSELFVNRMTLRFAPGLLRMTLNCIGKTVTTGQTFTTASLSSTAAVDAPFAFHDSASNITIRSGSGTQEIIEGELVIDNACQAYFRNSQTATAIRATDRRVTFRTNIPLTTTTLSTYFGDKAAADATIVLTNGTVTATWTLYNLKNPDQSPQLNGKNEVPLILESVARADSSDPDINFDMTGGSL